MRRFFLMLATAVFVVSVAVPMLAAGDEMTLTGELIETACYTRLAERERTASPDSDGSGPGHAACARTCASSGAELGILTARGIFRIIGDMTMDNNAKLMDYVAKRVEVKGDVTEIDDKMWIDVASIR